MKVFADLHLHSSYSRATSKKITLKSLERYARIKGLNLLGTSDFTHPEWLKGLKNSLTEDSGILKSESGFNFILSTEISNIYKHDGKQRRVHNLIFSPNFDVVDSINSELLKHGRLDYDGRPIFGLTCPELADIVFSESKDCMIIPAHILTPWYSIFGSKSGFDSVEECFQDQTKNIHALETGLSSDPVMDRRISGIDDFTLVSFSDAHSMYPWRLGREFCCFDLEEVTYKNVTDSIKRGGKNFLFTGEFPPELGKYHWTGHRKCNINISPKQALKSNNICPVCGGKLTVGVEQRVEELADREPEFILEGDVPFKTLIPLFILIKTKLGIDTFYSKTIWGEYNRLIKSFGDELGILLDVPEEELKKVTGEELGNLIIMNREGNIDVIPGYDGVYGEPIIDGRKEEAKRIKKSDQKKLLDFKGP